MPPCGGAPYSRASSKKPNALASLLFAEAQRGENLRLHVAAMDTNRARAQLRSVQHQIVRFGAAMRRVCRQLVDILVVNRSERMVRRVPAAFFLIPLEHREIHHPQELEIPWVQQLVPVVVLLRGVQTQLAACLQNGLLGTADPSARRPIPRAAANPLRVAPVRAFALRPSPPDNRDPVASDRRTRAARAPVRKAFSSSRSLRLSGARLRDDDRHQRQAFGSQFCAANKSSTQ